MANTFKYQGQLFLKKSFSKLDFAKGVSVIMIANSEKRKMKISYSILVSPTDFLKKFLSLRDFILPL